MVEDEITNFVEDSLDKIFTILTKWIIDITANNEEHVCSDLVRHFISDLQDGSFVIINLSLEFFSAKRFFFQEGLDSFFLGQNEKVVVVNLQG